MINFVRVVGLVGDFLAQGYGIARFLYISVKAGSISGMAAARAVLADFEDECVLIAVREDFLHDLSVAGGGALVPELLSAARKVNGFADGERLAEGFFVHVSDHQHFIRLCVLSDGDDEPVFVEFRGKSEAFFESDPVIAGSEGDFS